MAAKLGGSKGSGRFNLGQNSDINVTPFVDVMLVLLIIFMVAIPAATVSIKLDLPPAVPPPPGTKVKEPVLINIQQGGNVFIGDKATNLDSLITDLSAKLSQDDPTIPPPQQRVYIRADKSVRYGDFMAVMNVLQGNGFYQVALINEELS
jgi:biopolymer transport protein ExbD